MERKKVLIIDDNPRKTEKTKNQVLTTLPDALVHSVVTAKEGVRELMTNEYDVAIIDMQMPIMGRDINLEGGIYVLDRIKYYGDEEVRKIDTRNLRYCINSSAMKSSEIMKTHGYHDVMFILNDGMHSVKDKMAKLLL